MFAKLFFDCRKLLNPLSIDLQPLLHTRRELEKPLSEASDTNCWENADYFS
jgi:hypothetical protein